MRGIRQSYCEDMDRREPWKPLHTILTSHPDTSTSRNLRVGNFHLEAPTRQSCPVRLNGSCILAFIRVIADREQLLNSGSQHVENQYILSGQDPGFYSMLGILRDLVAQRVLAASAAQPPTPAATAVTGSDGVIPHRPSSGEQDNTLYFPVDEFGYDGTIEEDIWSRVLGNDLSAGVMAENPAFDVGYQFFGLPGYPQFRPGG